MKSFNQVTIMGNLTDAPEINVYGETTIAKFSLALNRSKKVDGEWIEETDFIQVTAFGKLAEHIGKQSKGNRIIVIGSLRQETWKDKETGKNRSKIGVYAQSVVPLTKEDNDI